ncbi:hypothetical protein DXT76_16805 [Halobacillus trueperi]|uniref:Uncharacterized protein n=1 Tax=Halobacillus trueperi TaxID=156205 RepID=A0A3D8VIF2_9BACI|nr:hypothetical protein [Halobacillus trueperi]RDY69115.1 hypothetical protein DXT76_16805 [Halobacillus trueperi]
MRKRSLYIIIIFTALITIALVLGNSKSFYIGENNNWKVQFESELNYLNVTHAIKINPKVRNDQLPTNIEYVIYEREEVMSRGTLQYEQQYTSILPKCPGCKHFKVDNIDLLLTYEGHPSEKISLKMQ